MMTQYNNITSFFTIFSLILLFGCQSGSVERQRNGDERFKTTAPSLIYFKNIKSLKYRNDRNPRTQMDFYRPKAFTTPTNLPVIYPVIVHNWLEDESYLIFEKKNIEEEAKIWVETITGDTISFNWPSEDYLAQLIFVQDLEKHLRVGEKVLIEVPDEGINPVEYSLSQRTSFTTVIQDFKNLTETASSRAKK